MTEERRSRTPDHPGERSLSPIFRRSWWTSFLESADSGCRARSPGKRDHGEGRPASSRRHLRRIRRHAGEQRRAGAAIFPGVRANRKRRCAGELAMAGRSGMVFRSTMYWQPSRRIFPQLAPVVEPRPPQSSAWPVRRFRASPIATADSLRSRQISASSSPSRPMIRTPLLPIPWRALPASRRARCSPSSGLPVGTPSRR